MSKECTLAEPPLLHYLELLKLRWILLKGLNKAWDLVLSFLLSIEIKKLIFTCKIKKILGLLVYPILNFLFPDHDICL